MGRIQQRRPQQNSNMVRVQWAGNNASISNSYSVGLAQADDWINSANRHICFLGDSTSSFQACPRNWYGALRMWNPTLGWSGVIVPANQSATGPLTCFDDVANPGGESCWPISGVNIGVAGGVTRTDYWTATDFDTQVLAATQITPIAMPCSKFVCSTNGWGYQAGNYIRLGYQGASLFGPIIRAGDFITGATDLRFGIIYLRTPQSYIGNVEFTTWQGRYNNTGGAGVAAVVVDNVALGARTSAGTVALDVKYVTVPAARVAAAFGTTHGPTKALVIDQYNGYGTTLFDDAQTAADIVAASYANATGCCEVEFYCNSNTAYNNPANLTGGADQDDFIVFGTVIDRTASTGLFMSNLSFSGASTRHIIDEWSAAQLGAAFNVVTTRPVDTIFMQIGYNSTAAEYTGGVFVSAEFQTNLNARIARVYAAADLVGIARPKIILVSNPNRQDATTGGPHATTTAGMYTAQATVMRNIAIASGGMVWFWDQNAVVSEHWTNAALFDPTRSGASGNLEYDALHQSKRFVEWCMQMFWHDLKAAA